MCAEAQAQSKLTQEEARRPDPLCPLFTPKIFDPFVTTKKKEHGTGLGLYICQRILAVDDEAQILALLEAAEEISKS